MWLNTVFTFQLPKAHDIGLERSKIGYIQYLCTHSSVLNKNILLPFQKIKNKKSPLKIDFDIITLLYILGQIYVHEIRDNNKKKKTIHITITFDIKLIVI